MSKIERYTYGGLASGLVTFAPFLLGRSRWVAPLLVGSVAWTLYHTRTVGGRPLRGRLRLLQVALVAVAWKRGWGAFVPLLAGLRFVVEIKWRRVDIIAEHLSCRKKEREESERRVIERRRREIEEGFGRAKKLNEEFLASSKEMDRSIIPVRLEADFLDVHVPLWNIFTKLRLLGEGSHGKVYEAVGPDSRTYAIKKFGSRWVKIMRRLHLAGRNAEPLRASCEDEFKVGLACDHPGVMRVHHAVFKGMSTTGESIVPYLISEIVRGHPLRSFCPGDSTLALCSFFDAYLHMLEKGFVYWDDKDENLLLRDSQVTIVDLGGCMPVNAGWKTYHFLQGFLKIARALTPFSREKEMNGLLAETHKANPNLVDRRIGTGRQALRGLVLELRRRLGGSLRSNSLAIDT